MSQIIPINFTLTGNQTHALIGYRPLGSQAQYSIVMPYPTVAPYNLELPDGIWDIFVQPSCDKVIGGTKGIDVLISTLACAKPGIISVTDDAVYADGVKMHIVNAFVSIPVGVQMVEWYLDGVKVRESLNVQETFEIPDDTWSKGDVVVGVVSRCSSTSVSPMATYTLAFTKTDPSLIVCPVPVVEVTAITDTTFKVNVILPGTGEGISINTVSIGYKIESSVDDYVFDEVAVADLPKIYGSLQSDTRYLVVAKVQCGDGTTTVWSGNSAAVVAVTEAAGVIPVEYNPPPFLIVDVLNDTQVLFSWDVVENGTGYRLSIIKVLDGTELGPFDTDAVTTEENLNIFEPGTDYIAKVKTLYSSAESDYGQEIPFTTSVGQGGGTG
jgi:hypothetical protein